MAEKGNLIGKSQKHRGLRLCLTFRATLRHVQSAQRQPEQRRTSAVPCVAPVQLLSRRRPIIHCHAPARRPRVPDSSTVQWVVVAGAGWPLTPACSSRMEPTAPAQPTEPPPLGSGSKGTGTQRWREGGGK